MHAKSERRRSVSYVDPSMLRSPVRASFAMLRSDKHPPLGPSSAHRHPLRAPLQIDRTIPHARRSSCTASSSASPRPHRGRNRGEGASEISHRRVFVPPHTIASSSHLAVSPRTSPSHASPISPSSLLRRLLHLLLLLHRPTSRYSRIDLLPQQLFTLSPSSSHRCRRRIRGSYRRVPLPSGRFPPSRFEAACCGRPLPAAEGQRDALSPLLARSLRLTRSHPFRFSFV